MYAPVSAFAWLLGVACAGVERSTAGLPVCAAAPPFKELTRACFPPSRAGGTVTEVNKVLSDDPGLVNKGAESSAWFCKMKLTAPAEVPTLLDTTAYAAVVAAAKH